MLGTAYELNGKYADAITAFNKANQLAGDETFSLADLGIVYGLSGKTDKATAILDQLLDKYKQGRADPFDIALVYTNIGKKSEAFEWFNKAADARSFAMVFLKTYPLVDSLRSDPRFPELLRRVGLS